MTLQQAFDDFILSRRLADLSPKTISDYQQFILPFLRSVGVNTAVDDIQQGNINDYIKSLLNRSLSKATRSTYIRHLKIFLKWVQQEYNVNYDCKRIKVPKNPKKQVRIYSDDELLQIFSCIHAESDWMTARNKCIIALMYDSGLRQSEVCHLKRSCVYFSEKRMVVYGKGSKERIVPLGALTARFMKDYFALCPYSADTVFVNRRGAPLTCNAVKLLVGKISDKLDFEFSSHKLRHNFATNYCIDQYEENGQIDIYRLMVIMGHEDVETTRRYLHHANEIIGTKNSISHLDKVIGREN